MTKPSADRIKRDRDYAEALKRNACSVKVRRAAGRPGRGEAPLICQPRLTAGRAGR